MKHSNKLNYFDFVEFSSIVNEMVTSIVDEMVSVNYLFFEYLASIVTIKMVITNSTFSNYLGIIVVTIAIKRVSIINCTFFTDYLV